MRRVVSLLAILVALIAGVVRAPPAAAKESESSGSIDMQRSDGSPGSVSYRATWGPPPRGAGWSFACIDVSNEHDRPHEVRLGIETSGNYLAVVRRTVRLEPGARTRVWLPNTGDTYRTLRMTLENGASTEDFEAPDRSALVALVVRAEADSAERLARETAISGALQAQVGSGHGSSDVVEFYSAGPSQIPPSWTLLTGCSFVIVEGATRGLEDAERQRTLLRYVRAGGTLVVVGRASLPKGPVADVVDVVEDGEPVSGNAVRRGSAGFGRWLSVNGEVLSEAAVEAIARTIVAKSPDGTEVSLEALNPLPTAFATAEEIPGLVHVDVRLYFLLLLGFAILVGPVAYLVLKRRRRLTALVFVIPVAGLGFAGAILAWGLLTEGFGTRGVVTSVSFLDQREHEATCVARRTLYAGWSPASLRLSPDTVLQPRKFDGHAYYSMGISTRLDRFVLDADTGILDGTALPSRMVTPFTSASRSRARERIRFQRRPDGGYDVRTADGFGPVPRAGAEAAILLRDAAGDYYLGSGGSAPLRPVDSAGATDFVAAFRAAAGHVQLAPEADDEPPYGPYRIYMRGRYRSGHELREDDAASRAHWSRRALHVDGLPPSSYAAWTTRAPGFDDLGLEVRWERATHLTIGLVAADDFDE